MSQHRSALLASVLLGLAGTVALAAAATPQAQRQTLPDGVVPQHYDLIVTPDPEALTFRGTVRIRVNVTAATSTVTLNASELQFDKVSMDGAPAAKVTLDKELGRAALAFDVPIASGPHQLEIAYHGKIGRSTLGFFAMDYTSAAGPRRTLATNFEPADARDFLPCWDEPGIKATFSVAVDAPKDRMAVSNMPVAETTALSPTLQRVRFAETPKMSTYLLFVAVGDFERIHKTVDGVDVGVVVKRGDTTKASYALEQAGALLHYYNDYFGIAYPLPKLDLVAAPGQIEGGSMENWGAIFYSQNHVLFDPQTSTERDRQLVFLVVAHEMAHQWFGDLVTMAWWDDLWLNEGFARWMQTYAADDLHPQWQTALQAADIYEEGKAADALPSTHPVLQRVDTADQAQESFDNITYDKGAAVITMINAYVGRDKFRDGVRRYMQAHAYGNTTDTDLWREIQQTAGLPILDIEHDFTRQEGLPLVRAEPQPGAVALSTARFADDPQTLAGVAVPRWRLPLAAGTLGGPYPYVLLDGRGRVPVKPPALINAGQLGYARVLYAAPLFGGLARHLDTLQPMDQLGLLNDSWALGVAGYAPADRVLELIGTLPARANAIVWQRVLRILTNIDHHYEDGAARQALRSFALRTLAPVARELGSGSAAGSASAEITRTQLQEAQARFGDAAVITAARERYQRGDGTAAQQRTALEIVAQQADAATFERLLKRAQETPDPLAKLNIYRALSRVADPDLARRMIDVASSEEVPAGTHPGLLVQIASEHPDLAWEALAPRFDDPKLPLTKQQRWFLAGAVAAYSARSERIAELERYETAHVPAEARKPFLGSVADIQRNQRIVRTVIPQLNGWISAHGGASTGAR